jgi:NAD(P)-dependent dehydrogenase (short-subunit alcohol dehydrogenase family)|tara:strand:- start:16 stop:762 length:747 start_codon:yes stop_codon:yes gene_type:complete
MKNKKKNILILGASSDIGLSLLQKINYNEYFVGAHCNSSFKRLSNNVKKNKGITIFTKNLSSQLNCHNLVDQFIKKAGKIDVLVQLTGNIDKSISWEKLKSKNLNNDININLNSTIYVSQKVFTNMKKRNSGKFIFTSTGSTNHGGNSSTLGYALSKAGIELFSKTLAKEGGKYNITSNSIAPGFISTRFHTKKLKKNKKSMKERANLNILKRAGSVEDVSNLIYFLISNKSDFITGENIPITGGDWL